jgi:hypothetical protein
LYLHNRFVTQIIVFNVWYRNPTYKLIKEKYGGCNYDDGFVLEILLLCDVEHCKLLLFARCAVHERFVVLCKA